MTNRIRFWLLFCVAAVAFSSTGVRASVLVPGNTYSENFNSGNLGSTSLSSTTTPPSPFSATAGAQSPIPAGSTSSGWVGTKISGTGTVQMPYTVDAGTNTSGAILNFGAVGDTDRALGSLASGTNIPAFGVELINVSGVTIDNVNISYIGEFWRNSTITQNVLQFGYYVGTNGAADFLTTASANSASSLNLVGPPPVTTQSALNGNDPANRATFSGLLTGLNWTFGGSLYLRWQDANDTGNDAGLAVDDFSLSVVTIPKWTGGGGNGNWSSAANWTVLPANGNDLTFSGTTQTNTINNSFLTSAASITFDSTAGAFTLNGSGSGANLTLSGSITNSSANTQTIGMNLNFTGSQSLNATSGDLVFNGSVTSTGGLTKNGTSSVIFNNSVNNVGALKIAAGKVNIATGAAVTADYGNSATTTWDSGLTGNGAFNISVGIKPDNSSQGALQLNSGVDSSGFSGPVNVTGGGEIIPQSISAPLGSGPLHVLTSGLQIIATTGAAGTLGNNVVMHGNDGAFKIFVGATRSGTSNSTLTVGPISGTGSVVVQTNALPGTTTGTPAVPNPPETPSTGGGGGNVLLQGSSTYSGDTIINLGNTGTFKILNSDALPTGTNVKMGTALAPQTGTTPPVSLGGVWDLNGFNQEVASLASGPAGAGSIVNSGSNNSTLKISGTGNTTFGLPIHDGVVRALSLQRSGSGSTILSGGSNYTGGTTISGGKITAGAPSVDQLTLPATTTANSATVTVSNTNGVAVGQPVSGGGFPGNTFVTAIAGATMTLSNATTVVGTGVPITFGAVSPIGQGTLTLSGGTFSSGGFNETIPAPLLLTASSHLDLGAGGASKLRFLASNADWTGLTLTVDNWTNGSDHLYFGTDSSGLNAAQLSRITFTGTGLLPGVTINASTGEVIPNGTLGPVLIKGDINNDGHVNGNDISALLTALKDVNAAQGSLTNDQFLTRFDVNQDGALDNPDLQALITKLTTGGGSVTTVPEPATWALFGFAAPAVLIAARRRR